MTDDVVLLLPGMTLNASVFPDFGMRAVTMDFTRLVVSPTGWSAELATKRMGFYVERLREQLQRHPAWSGAARRVAVAHSFGGFLALAWQADRPGDPLARIDGLVLLGTSAGPMYDAVRLRLFGGERWAVRVPVGTLMWLWNQRGLTQAIARLTAPNGRVTEVDFRRLGVRSDLAMGLAGWRNTDWRARRSYRFAMQGFDVRDRLPAITVPTIVLHGPRDSFFPVEVARDLARRLPRAELRVVPGAAHALPLTHGHEVVRAVGDLITP
ncbi:MAG: alpha/beta hydrolase [Gemmatimonadetes bacterium]|nr:alpha/beta hydrolase [Gemmatimonadota bacterium]MBI2402471.1 alpha/beta hydrolase [Gemmatimonadota bacterium]MBI2615425.1 alpha/beta hydrolase [Gemmatimonadota bacterium]